MIIYQGIFLYKKSNTKYINEWLELSYLYVKINFTRYFLLFLISLLFKKLFSLQFILKNFKNSFFKQLNLCNI
jgi:hypothetical protein